MTELFAAGLDKNEFRRFREFAPALNQNFLHTFADFREERGKKYFIELMDQTGMWRPDARIFLDSGAYSAWRSGVPITLDDYMRFLEMFEDQFVIYASLDDKNDQAKTVSNYQALRSAGFTPAPVWHAIGGEADVLQDYMSDPNVPMVCIGAIAKERIKDDYAYERLDMVFSLVGKYKKPTHSFGRMEPELLTRYPFATADATTWYCCRHGALLDWNPMNRTLRQIRFSNIKAVQKAFGSRGKVLLGQMPRDQYPWPDYYYQTEHNMKEIAKYQLDIRAYWKRRGVEWNFDATINRDWRHNGDPAVRARCLALREASGIALPGDPMYTEGMYVGLEPTTRQRDKRKWERPAVEI